MQASISKKKWMKKKKHILGYYVKKFNLGYEIVKLLEIFSFSLTSQNFKILNWNFEIQFLHFFSFYLVAQTNFHTKATWFNLQKNFLQSI